MFQIKLLEKIKTHFMFNILFGNHMVYGIIRKMWWILTGHRWRHRTCALHVEYLRLQTHSEYQILTAFPVQHWLHEIASMFRLYVHYLSCPDFLWASKWLILVRKMSFFWTQKLCCLNAVVFWLIQHFYSKGSDVLKFGHHILSYIEAMKPK